MKMRVLILALDAMGLWRVMHVSSVMSARDASMFNPQYVVPSHMLPYCQACTMPVEDASPCAVANAALEALYSVSAASYKYNTQLS